MVILFDMDGVVVNIMENWLQEYNSETGDDLTVDRITAWETHTFAKEGTRIYDHMWREGFFNDAPPYPGALSGVKKIWDYGHEVYFASTPVASLWCAREKWNWVERTFPEIGRRNVILTWNKGMLRGDILVDDKPENLYEFMGTRFLMDRPWNRYHLPKDDSCGLIRCYGWGDVVVETVREEMTRTPQRMEVHG